MKVLVLALLVAAGGSGFGADFPAPYNSEDPSRGPIGAEEALRSIRLPRGFEVTLYAGEPAVQQPIAMTFDSRGRLWVAENYTYAEAKRNFDLRLCDRIVIFEDRDGDGRFDARTVFWDEGKQLTSIELGFGGVWALCAPNLIFIPDRDGDDIPDGPPEVLLDGWDIGRVRHNVVNGLKWGPDGWLYGRHGIQATSRVGPPGALPEERQRVNCAIWRFHPVRRTFEIVTRGTTNPWGMDWNEYGEAFFINTVIGHLWHVIPGAHYRRMYGEDFDADVYGLIDQHADHYHWNTGEGWSDVRQGLTQTSSAAGGGHAHVGLMIYLGDNWPDEYRGRALTLNFHGRRINQDRLERAGSGYMGRHEPDRMFFEDPWFRGIDLAYGPDGGVYVLDWSDTGECHEQDGVHRTSGRIYKIRYEPGRQIGRFDLSRLPDLELIGMLTHQNDWFARQSRRILQERAAAGPLPGVKERLQSEMTSENVVPRYLRLLWARHSIGAADADWLRELLKHPHDSVRIWAVRLLSDAWPLGAGLAAAPVSLPPEMIKLASSDSSAAVRLALASLLQRLPLAERQSLALPLLAHDEDASDHNIPLMLWYGIKDIVAADPAAAVVLAQKSAIPLVRRFIARRLGEASEASGLESLLRAGLADRALVPDIVEGLTEGVRGRRRVPVPESWAAFRKALEALTDPELRQQGAALSLVFGSGRALEELQRTALDESVDLPARREALRTLIEHRAPELRQVCEGLLTHRELAGQAAAGLAQMEDPAIAELLVARYRQFHPFHRPSVLSTLVARPGFAKVLLENVGDEPGRVPRADISAFHARQIRSFGDRELARQLAKVWGQARETEEARRQTIADYRRRLTPEYLQGADRGNGQALFNQACASCHRLYGQGGLIGPDLTGAGRDNLEYLLENLVDPSAMVAEDFRMSILTLRDGRILNGVVLRRGEGTVDLQTVNERLVLPAEDVLSQELSGVSLMPEGLLEGLSAEQVRDLVGFLMSKPAEGPGVAP